MFVSAIENYVKRYPKHENFYEGAFRWGEILQAERRYQEAADIYAQVKGPPAFEVRAAAGVLQSLADPLSNPPKDADKAWAEGLRARAAKAFDRFEKVAANSQSGATAELRARATLGQGDDGGGRARRRDSRNRSTRCAISRSATPRRPISICSPERCGWQPRAASAATTMPRAVSQACRRARPIPDTPTFSRRSRTTSCAPPPTSHRRTRPAPQKWANLAATDIRPAEGTGAADSGRRQIEPRSGLRGARDGSTRPQRSTAISSVNRRSRRQCCATPRCWPTAATPTPKPPTTGRASPHAGTGRHARAGTRTDCRPLGNLIAAGQADAGVQERPRG